MGEAQYKLKPGGFEYLIDANVFVNFKRFYYPFDHSGKLIKFVEKKFRDGTFILLQVIWDEVANLPDVSIAKEFSYLNPSESQSSDKQTLKIKKVPAIIPEKAHHEYALKHWVNPKTKKKLERHNKIKNGVIKDRWFEQGDFNLIAHAMKSPQNRIIVTNETPFDERGNNRFKKIPIICKMAKDILPVEIEIKCINQVELMNKFGFREISWS